MFYLKSYRSFSLWPLKSSKLKHRIIQPGKVSKKLTVPQSIQKPDYRPEMIQQTKHQKNITIKTKKEIELLREACKLASYILKYASTLIKIGTTTDEIDRKVHEEIVKCGAYPSPLDFLGFPKSCCISINNVLCHGIPDDTVITDGDVVNIDISVYLDGFHGDTSQTFAVGKVDDAGKQLISVTQTALKTAIECCKPGQSFRQIADIIQKLADKYKFSICRNFVGHGIGKGFHEPPDVYHTCTGSITEIPMAPGMSFTIEPIILEGSERNKTLNDGWTVVSIDNMRSAQMEHTILITENGYDILTN